MIMAVPVQVEPVGIVEYTCGSRFAPPSKITTVSPLASRLPSTVRSSRAKRAVRCTGAS